MADFTKLYITDAGKELLNQKLNSEKALLFTEMVMSNQRYDVEGLEKLTAIEGIRQRTDIRRIERTGNTIQLSAIFLNSELDEGYAINTLGVYAQFTDSPAVLFAVAVEQMEAAYMPQSTQTVSGIEIKLKITLENACNITIQLDQSAVATVGDILDIENRTQNAIDAVYQQGTGYTDTKIAELINGAPSTLDTLGEIAKAMQDNADVVAAIDQAIGTKASQAELDGHTKNNTIHITASEKESWNGKVNKSGDTMVGKLQAFGGLALNETTTGFSASPRYLLGMDPYADGGTVHYKEVEDIHVGSADSANYAATAGKADSATKAGSADSAAKATNADYAAKAGSADSATKATNADYATNAGTANGATHASTADNASFADTARNAENANHSNGFAFSWQQLDDPVWVVTSKDGKEWCKVTPLSGLSVYRASKSVNADQAEFANSAGSAAHATNATNDGDGRNIRNTYMPYTGGKFSGDVTFKNEYKIENRGGQEFYLFPKETDYGFFHGVREGGWRACPSVHASTTLGSPSFRWGQPYFSSPAITTSDRDSKKDISPISDRYLDLFDLIQPVVYKFKDGTSGRLHVGYIAQDVEAAMEQIGLDSSDFAGFCKDKKQKAVRTRRHRPAVDAEGIILLDADGNTIMEEYDEITMEDDLDADGDPLYTYSLRYEEFIALNMAAIKRQQQQIDALTDRVTMLEEQIGKQS